VHALSLLYQAFKKYYANCVDQDDLISVGTIGLIKAINTFNVGKGARLATYAARCIDKPSRPSCPFRPPKREVPLLFRRGGL